MSKNSEKFEFASEMITPSGIIVPDTIDKKTSAKWISWGNENKLPAILWDNYLKCSNLQAIVNTMVDFIYGENVKHNYIFDSQYALDDEIRKCIFDFVLFGGFALEGIRNKIGDIVILKHINVMQVRVNEDLTTAYLSGKWNSYSGKDIQEFPLFDKSKKQEHFIFYYRGHITRGINPVPCYVSALKSIFILNNTRNFHLKNLENGFSASVIVSLNNGNIKQRELDDIKQKFQQQYTGSENAGKFMIINAQDKDHAPTVERLNADNFGDLYNTLSESSVNDIFVAFRMNPVLLGVNIQSGFQAVEYRNIFELYFRTVILPIQKQFIRCFSELDIELSFEKFKIDFE